MEVEKDGQDFLKQFFDFMEGRQEDYTARLAAHFGHLEEELLIRVMAVTRQTMLLNQSDRLRELLGEAQIVVPGNNEISREQIDVLTGAYAFNRQHWDRKIDTWQLRNRES